MIPSRLIALFGRKDEPTDALRDYCRYLCAALGRRGIEIETSEVSWDRSGWIASCKRLWRQSVSWKQSWVLLQYTALSWSRRGIPAGLLPILVILKARGVRVAIVFHDSNPFSGSRFIDRLRRHFQRSVMRCAYRRSDKSFFSIPVEKISWLPANSQKARFIPIGANIPAQNGVSASTTARKAAANGSEPPLTIAIFGITGGAAFDREFRQIVHAVSRAGERLPRLRLTLIGRGTEQAGPALQIALKNTNVALSVSGMLPDAEVASELADADVMLFARGHLTGSRGSALAGIACGLPLVAYRGAETGAPITEAGIAWAPSNNADALADALVRVLSDDTYRQDLRARSRRAYQAYFSWDRIADRFCAELAMADHPYRVLMIASHPVQYMSPIFRDMARHPRLHTQVAYCSLQGAAAAKDPGFGVDVQWDIPLLEGYQWFQVPNSFGEPRIERFWGLINPQLWRLPRKENFDVVVAFTGYAYASFWIALAAAKLRRVPFIFGTDATSIAPRNGSRWRVLVKKLLLPRIFSLGDVVLVNSTAGGNFVRSLGIAPDRIVMTPFVVDNDWWLRESSRVDRESVRESWGVPRDAHVALFCAKLQPWKRPQDALRAFIRANVSNSHLVFAGDGPLRQQLQREAESAGFADRVHFLGFVNQSALPSVYRASDLLVLPSEYDPCPVVVAEAMLCGCPAAISDQIRGRFDIVHHDQTGFIFPCADIDTLASVLQDALSNPDRLNAIRSAATKRMETWTIRENVEAMVEAFGRACHQRPDSPPISCATRAVR